MTNTKNSKRYCIILDPESDKNLELIQKKLIEAGTDVLSLTRSAVIRIAIKCLLKELEERD